jgi:hypothetical protein
MKRHGRKISCNGREATAGQANSGMEKNDSFYRDEGDKRDAHHRILVPEDYPRLIQVV